MRSDKGAVGPVTPLGRPIVLRTIVSVVGNGRSVGGLVIFCCGGIARMAASPAVLSITLLRLFSYGSCLWISSLMLNNQLCLRGSNYRNIYVHCLHRLVHLSPELQKFLEVVTRPWNHLWQHRNLLGPLIISWRTA